MPRWLYSFLESQVAASSTQIDLQSKKAVHAWAGPRIGGGIVKIVILAIVLAMSMVGSFLPGSAAESLTSSWQGYYVNTGIQPQGDTRSVEVDVFPAYEGQAMYIDFAVTENSPEATLGAVSPAYGVNKRQFSFSFVDGWGNHGRGTFSRQGNRFVLRLDLVQKRESGAKGTELYGNYDLLKKESMGRPDRHSWSLGKVRPRP
jgi:hypothetical protein